MKKTIILLLLLFSTLSFAGKNILTFSNPGENLIILNKISIKVLKEAYEKIGIDIEVELMPTFRSIRFANRGITDGEINRIKGFEKKYTNLILIPVPINFVDEVVFAKNLDFNVDGTESLKPYHIGVIRGLKLTDILTKGMERTFLQGTEQMFFMLERERIDIVITDRVRGLEKINDMNLKNIRILEHSLIKKDLYHYLHKKHKSIADKLTKALKEMKRSGRIMQIRNEYIKELKEGHAVQK